MLGSDMTIIEMLNIWADKTSSIAKAGAARLDFPEGSIGLQGGSNGTWGTTFAEWEEENDENIKSTLDVLIYGTGRDKGILTQSEIYSIEVNHIADTPHTLVSNRGISIADDYSRALFKLKPAMIRRNFMVE